ncbi:MAG: proline racemase family protein [Deltaproteobacteria bacterium]|nr:proline racemase family protein [Deltaproteobacteria bacterium]
MTVDLHVGGEAIRLVVDGMPPVSGESMNDKRLYIQEHLDDVRLLLTREPRGHRDMFGAVITDPVSEGALFGMVFMDARRYPYMCGHGMIGALTAFVEMDWFRPDAEETTVRVDTPSGIVRAGVRVRRTQGGGLRTESVAIEMESAFAFLLDQPLEVPGLERIIVDVVFAGGFFVMVSAPQTGLALVPENTGRLTRLGMNIIDAANEQFRVQHPLLTYIDTVDVVEFYDPVDHGRGRGKNLVVLGEGHADRSACGTGTSAKLALLHRKGEWGAGRTFVNQGILGTTFEGRILGETIVGGLPAVVPEVRGTAHLTGLHRFLLTPDDPFPKGFLL